MDLPQSNLNRFLYKTNSDPSQADPIYMSSNINSPLNKNVQPTSSPGNEKDAPNVITGTVITDCIIQTSGLPHRVLIQDNDITFYDDTNNNNGSASNLIFQSANNDYGAFVMERRASNVKITDNVLSWYVTPAIAGSHNWLFIGREGKANDPERNLNAMFLAVNIVTADPASAGNGIWGVEIDTDGVLPTNFGILIGDTRSVVPSLGSGGYSTIISAEGGGVVGMSYVVNPTTQNFMWYITNDAYISMGATIIPDTDNAYDIGSASNRIKDLYISGTINGKIGITGQVTLVAGVAPAISDSRITSSSLVFLTRALYGGTTGDLYFLFGTGSVTIKSFSATDTSIINYLIFP